MGIIKKSFMERCHDDEYPIVINIVIDNVLNSYFSYIDPNTCINKVNQFRTELPAS